MGAACHGCFGPAARVCVGANSLAVWGVEAQTLTKHARNAPRGCVGHRVLQAEPTIPQMQVRGIAGGAARRAATPVPPRPRAARGHAGHTACVWRSVALRRHRPGRAGSRGAWGGACWCQCSVHGRGLRCACAGEFCPKLSHLHRHGRAPQPRQTQSCSLLGMCNRPAPAHAGPPC